MSKSMLLLLMAAVISATISSCNGFVLPSAVPVHSATATASSSFINSRSKSFSKHVSCSTCGCVAAASAARTGSVKLAMSDDEDYDYPSDYEAGEDMDQKSPVPVRDLQHDPQMRENIKKEIMTIAAISDRGQSATQEEKDMVADLVYQLEAMNPTTGPTNTDLIDGTWDLVYSDVEPFRSSPFFMAIETLFGENKQQAETAFKLHRAATANGEIGRVRQIFMGNTLFSEIDLRVGVVAGLPFALSGTVVSKASIIPSGADAFSVQVQSTKVKNNNLFKFLDEAVELPLEKIYSTVKGSVPETKYSTFYLDDNLRVSRTSDSHFFIFTRP